MSGPYSNFAVGAALKTTTGEIFTGKLNLKLVATKSEENFNRRMQCGKWSPQPDNLRWKNRDLQSSKRRIPRIRIDCGRRLSRGVLHVAMRRVSTNFIWVHSNRHPSLHIEAGSGSSPGDFRLPFVAISLSVREVEEIIVTDKKTVINRFRERHWKCQLLIFSVIVLNSFILCTIVKKKKNKQNAWWVTKPGKLFKEQRAESKHSSTTLI